MEYLEGAMNAPPPTPPPRRNGLKALLAGVLIVVALAAFGVSSVFAASPSPSASSRGASGSPAPNHVCDRNNSSSPSSTSSS